MVDEQEREATPQEQAQPQTREAGATPDVPEGVPGDASGDAAKPQVSADSTRPDANRASGRPVRPSVAGPGAPRGGGIPYRRSDQNQPGGVNRPQGAGTGAAGPGAPRPPQGPRPPFNGTIQPVGPAVPGVPGQANRPPMRTGGFRPVQPPQGLTGGPAGPRPAWVDLGRKPVTPRPTGPNGPITPTGPAPVGGPGAAPGATSTYRPQGAFPPRTFGPGPNGLVGPPTGPARTTFAPRPWTPRPPGAPFAGPPAAGRGDTKEWIRPKGDSRRARGGDKKGKARTGPPTADDAAAKRKLGPDGKPRAPLAAKPKPVALRPKSEILPAGARAAARAAIEASGESDQAIRLPRVLTVKDLAETLDVNAVDVIKSLMQNGIMASINQVIDYDTAEIIAADLGREVKPAATSVVEPSAEENAAEVIPQRKRFLEEDAGHLVTRPPVVTILGHVDHGKTSLLDAIRQTNVIATEAGGITQHIGAYQVEKNDHKITFLDTPGHAAFTAMRARGAQVTDIAILVVAADDGVQPQTLEALNHARAAQVPIIVALNKIDKEGANPDRVKQQLSDAGLVVEEWGGDTVVVPVSAKKKVGIDQLLEMILLVADMQDLKANPNRAAVGAIVEAQMDKAKGPLATVLVQHGTLKLGDTVLVGETYGNVKAMFNDKGKRVRKAEPAMPVGILGLPEVPQAGDTLEVVADEKTARALAMDRQEKRQRSEVGSSAKVSLEDLFAQIQAGNVKELNIILKADVQGSVEPIVNSLNKLGDEKVKVKVIHTGIGAISESDVSLAVASKAIVIGFNERMDPAAKHLVEKEGVDVRFYDIIYNLVDDVQKALQGMYEPKYQDVLEGVAEVRAVFKVGKTGVVAGCYVLEGPITRATMAKVVRDGHTIFTGKMANLRRFKDDVKEVEKGYECGISMEGFNDIQEKDIIETYRKERVS
jgi:translation initiation factor IF-2